MALACLFTSFAVKFHQALLSYGLVLGKKKSILLQFFFVEFCVFLQVWGLE